MTTRELLAFVIAPTTSGALQVFLVGRVGAVILAIAVAYLLAVVVGLPTFMVLRRIGWRSLPKFLLVGLLAGAVCGLALNLLWGYSGFSIASVLVSTLVFAAHGLFVSLSFWLLAYLGAGTNPTVVRQCL